MTHEQGYAYDNADKGELPEIPRAEARLADAIGATVVAVEQLDKRLERVLRPAHNTEASGPDMLSEVRPATAPSTDFLVAQTTRVEAIAAQVNDLLYRLAL